MRISLNKTKSIGKNRIDKGKLFSVLIILLPILYQYRGIGNTISFGELVLFPFIILYTIRKISTGVVAINIYLLLFYVVTFVTTLMNLAFDYFNIFDTQTLFLRLAFYGVLILVARDYFDYEYVKRIYIAIVFVCSIYLMLQYVVYYSSGKYLPMYVNYNLVFPPERRAATLEQQFRWYYRASSVFLEPSYFSLYSMPVVCILLFQKNRTAFETTTIVVASVALVASSAASGVVGVALMLTVYLFGKTRGKKTIYKILLVGGAVAAIAYYLTQVSSSGTLLSRLSSGGSFNQRILRGWIIYKGLPLYHKLFGVGVNNLQPYMQYFNLSTAYDETNLNLCCSVIQTMNYSGIIGLFSLITYMVYMFRKSRTILTKAYFILLSFILAYDSVLFMYRFAFLVITYEALLAQERSALSILFEKTLME